MAGQTSAVSKESEILIESNLSADWTNPLVPSVNVVVTATDAHKLHMYRGTLRKCVLYQTNCLMHNTCTLNAYAFLLWFTIRYAVLMSRLAQVDFIFGLYLVNLANDG